MQHDFFFFAKKAKSTPRETRYESVLYFWSLVVLFSCPFPLYNLCLKRCFLGGLLPLHGQFFTFVNVTIQKMVSLKCFALTAKYPMYMMNAFTFENLRAFYVTFGCFTVFENQQKCRICTKIDQSQCWKSPNMSQINFWISAFSNNYCLVTVWP